MRLFAIGFLLQLLVVLPVNCAQADVPQLLQEKLDASKITKNLAISDRTAGTSDNGRKRVRWVIRRDKPLENIEIIGNDPSDADLVAWHCGSYDKNGNFLSPVPINSFCGQFFISVLRNIVSSPEIVARTLLERAHESKDDARWRFDDVSIETNSQFFFIRRLSRL